MMMTTKLSRLKDAAARGNWQLALGIAAKFHDLGDHKAAIMRAHEALWNPDFYRQVGKDPDQLIAEGIQALKERYKL